MRLLLALALIFGLTHAAAAQSAPYRLRTGDTISVSVWEDLKLDRQLIVGPDGMISFPLVGQLRAGGLPLAAVEAALKEKLQPKYNEELDITVTLGNFEAKPITPREPLRVFVTGEVKSPGSIPLQPPGINVVQAIALSGGLAQFAATKRILIYRNFEGEEFIFHFNYKDFLAGRNLGANIELLAGDVIVVPEKGLFGQ